MCRSMLTGLLLLAAASANACFVRAPQPVQVWLDHVRIDVVNGIATKSYECGFRNPNGGAIVGGECYMELEPGAKVDDLSISVDGKTQTAEVLPVEEANQVFTKIVKEGGSPALLEYYGNQLIRTKLPRIAPGKTVVVKLRYTMPLSKRGDLYRISCLNTNPKSLTQTLKSASVTIRLRGDDPIKTLYSPTHEFETFEEADWDACIRWSQDNYTPVSPFVLYYKTAPGETAASLLAHRDAGEPGHFLLMVSPTLGRKAKSLSSADVLPKDVVFCVDASGSMLVDGKMEQAKAALIHCVAELREYDRFNIVVFGTTVSSWHKTGLRPATKKTRKAALEFVDELSARGGTAMDAALETAFGHFEKGSSDGRVPMVLFATDGLPTIGERDSEKILRHAEKANVRGARLFVFGEGYDVNTSLLESLARQHHGETDYILPEESIDKKIAAYFDRVGNPVLTDVKIEIEGVKADDLLPATLPVLLLGEQVMILGRYRGQGAAKIILTGQAGSEEKRYEYTVEFPKKTDDSADFVPRLWAGRRIDALLTDARGSEPDAAVIEEVVALARKYGLVTPHTAFLLNESHDIPNRPVAGPPTVRPPGIPRPIPLGAEASESVADSLRLQIQPPVEPEIRERQVRGAKALSEARQNASQSGNANDFYFQAGRQLATDNKGIADESVTLQRVRYIGDRAFFNRAGQWLQSDFESQNRLRKIEIGSTEYFDLLKSQPTLAQFLALGQVVFEANGEWIDVR